MPRVTDQRSAAALCGTHTLRPVPAVATDAGGDPLARVIGAGLAPQPAQPIILTVCHNDASRPQRADANRCVVARHGGAAVGRAAPAAAAYGARHVLRVARPWLLRPCVLAWCNNTRLWLANGQVAVLLRAGRARDLSLRLLHRLLPPRLCRRRHKPVRRRSCFPRWPAAASGWLRAPTRGRGHERGCRKAHGGASRR